MKRAANYQRWKPRLLAKSVSLMTATTLSFFLASVSHANPYGGGTLEVLGVCNNSCGKYTSRYSDPDWKGEYTSWLGGFITGVNYSNGDIDDISGGLDNTALLKWIYNYCDENPLATVATAAHNLMQHLYESGKYRETSNDK